MFSLLETMATVILNAPWVESNAESLKLLHKQALYQWSPWFTGNHSNWFQLPVKLKRLMSYTDVHSWTSHVCYRLKTDWVTVWAKLLSFVYIMWNSIVKSISTISKSWKDPVFILLLECFVSRSEMKTIIYNYVYLIILGNCKKCLNIWCNIYVIIINHVNLVLYLLSKTDR